MVLVDVYTDIILYVWILFSSGKAIFGVLGEWPLWRVK